MVRIRIKINVHDGTSQKGKLIDCISEVEAVVFKIIEGREAFFSLDRYYQYGKTTERGC